MLLLLGGCDLSGDLPWSQSAAEIQLWVLAEVPQGTSAAEAVRVMEAKKFRCASGPANPDHAVYLAKKAQNPAHFAGDPRVMLVEVIRCGGSNWGESINVFIAMQDGRAGYGGFVPADGPPTSYVAVETWIEGI